MLTLDEKVQKAVDEQKMTLADALKMEGMDERLQEYVIANDMNLDDALRIQARNMQGAGDYAGGEKFWRLADEMPLPTDDGTGLVDKRIQELRKRKQAENLGLQPVISSEGDVVGYVPLDKEGITFSDKNTADLRWDYVKNKFDKLNMDELPKIAAPGIGPLDSPGMDRPLQLPQNPIVPRGREVQMQPQAVPEVNMQGGMNRPAPLHNQQRQRRLMELFNNRIG